MKLFSTPDFTTIKTPGSVCVRAKSLQSCPTLWDPTDRRPPGSSVHGVLQARALEWVARPPPGDLPGPGITLASLSLLLWQAGSLLLAPAAKRHPRERTCLLSSSFIPKCLSVKTSKSGEMTQRTKFLALLLLLLLSRFIASSCPTLCDPIDSSPPGSLTAGILQARALEWAAISFSTWLC